jgi:glycerophosphoryl diester phosphodiesterase
VAAGVTVNTPPPWGGPAAAPLISAHRCGAGAQPEFDNSRAGVERALTLAGEYVEFDVQRRADGALVLGHEPADEAAGEACSLEAALELLAGHKLAHIDLKFTSPEALYDRPERTHEAGAAQVAQEIMGDGAYIITSLEDRSVRAVRDWADAHGLVVPVGLSLGRGLGEIPWLARPGVRASELFPARRVRQSRANLLVAHRRLARASLARWSARQSLPLLVWTVDEPASLRTWLSDPRVWLLTTNQPQLAAQIRTELRGTSA